eukprot:588832_1
MAECPLESQVVTITNATTPSNVVVNNESSMCDDTNKTHHNTNKNTSKDRHAQNTSNNKKKRKLRLVFKKRNHGTTPNNIRPPPKKKQKMNPKHDPVATKKKRKKNKTKTLRKKKRNHHKRVIKLSLKPRHKKRKRQSDSTSNHITKKRKLSHHNPMHKDIQITRALARYHHTLRTTSEWLEGVLIGDVLEWKIPTNATDKDAKYIPVKILNRAYRAKIRYYLDHTKHYEYINIGNRMLKNKAQLKHIQYIRPKHGIRENPQENPWLLEKLKQTDNVNTRCHGNAFDESSSNLSSLWVRKGKEIEIYIRKRKQWVVGKIVRMNSYFEFMYSDSDYVQNKRVVKYSESIINNTNFRLPLQCLPFTAELVDYNLKLLDEDTTAQDTSSTEKRKRDITRAIALPIRIYLGPDQDRDGLFEGSWCDDGILYDIHDEDGTLVDVLFSLERMLKTVQWTSEHCLFYFPIRGDIFSIKHWVDERPICDCTTQMNERLVIRNNEEKCHECKVEFVYNDSLWFCPKETTIRHHKKCFYLCARCVLQRPCIIIHIDEDKPRHEKNTRCSYRYERLVGNNGAICDALQAPKILLEVLHSFYHNLLYYPFDDDELMQLLDEPYLDIEDDATCMIPCELKQLALQYLARSNLKALYYIYKAADYRHYHLHYAVNQSQYIPPLLRKNEIIIQDTDSEDEPLQHDSEDEPLVAPPVNADEDRTIRIKNERTANMDEYTSEEEDDSEVEPIISTVQVDPITSNLNNPALTMPALEQDRLHDDPNAWNSEDNMDRFNDDDVTPEPMRQGDKEEEEPENEDEQDDVNVITPSPSPPPELRIVPYRIPGPPPTDKHSANWMNSVYNVTFNDEIAEECKAAKYGLLSIKTENVTQRTVMRGIHGKPKRIREKLESDADKILSAHVATYTAQQRLEGEDVMWANPICVADDDKNNNEKRYNVLHERGINPWFAGDLVRVYHQERDVWLNGKVVETIWNPKAKSVLIHHYDLPWIVDKKYAIFSLDVVPIFHKNVISDLCSSSVVAAPSNKRLLLIDRLKNGTPVKIWGPPWRYGRVLWRWNDGDLVCVQFNGQNIENCKTFHAHNKRWKITILAHDRPDTTGCVPPPTLTMAKSMDVTLKIDLVSSDSEHDSEDDVIMPPKEPKPEPKQEVQTEKEGAEMKKKTRKKKVDGEDGDSDYLYDELANIDNVDHAQKFKELQDNFMEFIENEDDADIGKRGIIITQAVEQEINKKYDLIEIVNVTNIDKSGEKETQNQSTTDNANNKPLVSQNMIDCNVSEFNKDGTRRFYRTRNRTSKINKIAKIKKYKLLSDDENNSSFYNILVYGIEEGSCFYPQQNVLILWKFMNENHRNLTLEFEICLQHKQYLNVIPKGKKRKKLSVYWDKISMLGRRNGRRSIWIKCNSRGEYMYNTQLPKDIECNQDIYKINVCLRADRNCQGNSFEFEVRSIMCCANLQQQFLSALGQNKHTQHRITAPLRADNEYDMRNKDYSKDNGVWCPCGAVATTREDYESDFSVEWVQCDECKTWQHIDCLQIPREDINMNGAYLCPWCNNTCNGFSIGELKPLFAKFMKSIWMLNEACSYKRKSKVIYGNTLDIIEGLNEQSLDDLKRLGLKRGLVGGAQHHVNKNELISILTESPIFARTPNNLGKYISTLICEEEGEELRKSKVKLRLADLMAGNGNITQWLPGYHILAVEKNKQRYESGRRCVQRATWLNCDIFSEYFIKNYVFRCKPFDIVVSNPDFEFGFAAIYVGLLMIRGNPNAKLIFLLPMDFFNGTKIRQRLYRICNFHIEKMYSVGRWNYYKDRYFKSHPKIHCDCIYVIKPGKYSKFSCVMKQALIAKDLINHET